MNYLTKESRVRIGLRIRTARKQAGLSHDRLAVAVGSSRQHLIKLEKGKHAPREELLQRIADATGKKLTFFTADENDIDDEEADPLAALAHAIDVLLRSRLRTAATQGGDPG